MLNDENTFIFPKKDIENEIANCLQETKQYLVEDRIIQAYYNLKKTNKMINQLTESTLLKNKYIEEHKLLNNQLNSKILKLIEKQ
ncbi:MAG: hypothetical protein JXR51_08825 [Bacteroidales bacterium]|nr:hypothetical protein [Bacteroidales bacterium]